MFAYVARRILTTIPLLVIGTFIVYALTSQVADPLAPLRANPNIDESAYQRIIDLYDLDEPVPVRYANWVSSAVLEQDMGESPSVGGDVYDLVSTRAANSARLAIPAFVLIATAAVVLGVYSAVNQYKTSDYIITGFTFFGISMPTFVFGLTLQVLFVVYWQRWFNGAKPFVTNGMATGSFGDVIASHTLPIITLMLVLMAGESRFQRAAMLEVLNADYIRTARAKGLPERLVIFKHAMRNAMIPLVTIWAIDFAALLGGSIVTETIFSWPGLGPLLIEGINRSDLNLTMGVVLLIAVLVVVFNLLADLVYAVLDPRIRYD